MNNKQLLSRKLRTVFFFSLILILVSLVFPTEEIVKTPKGIERLKNRIDGVIQSVEGTIGVAVKHLETGEELYINGSTFFPMASVFKIPIFVEVMAQIIDGKFTLDDEINVQKPDQHLGSGMLSDLDAPGIRLSVRNLINLMMMISDNSATDILLTKVSAEKVNSRLQSFGIDNMTVNRTCQNLILDTIGVDSEKYKEMTLEEVIKTYRKEMEDNPQAFEEATKKFSQIQKDQSTPLAMNRLLEMVFKKEILDPESCEHIISVMLKCQTGGKRIKGDLPGRVKVAHKTGTIGGTVNNVGIIYLPDNLGHVALTIFSKDMELKTREVEDKIAQIARFVFDYFYFTS